MADTKPAQTDTKTPTVELGQTVLYTLTQKDAERLDIDRLTTLGYGNLPHALDTVPAIVVAVDRETVNLHALMDGNDRLWVPGVTEGDEPGQWHHPARD